jgi:hypothetical protein
MGAQGTAVLDFGAAPGANSEASLAVAAAGIAAGSSVEAWIRHEATADHTLDEVRFENVKILAGGINAGVGFTIYGEVLKGCVWGRFNVDWVWNT